VENTGDDEMNKVILTENINDFLGRPLAQKGEVVQVKKVRDNGTVAVVSVTGQRFPVFKHECEEMMK